MIGRPPACRLPKITRYGCFSAVKFPMVGRCCVGAENKVGGGGAEPSGSILASPHITPQFHTAFPHKNQGADAAAPHQLLYDEVIKST